MAKFFNYINPFHNVEIRTSSLSQRFKDTFKVFAGSFNWKKFTSFKPNGFFEQVGVLDWATLFIPKILCYLLLLPLRSLVALYKAMTNTVDVIEDSGPIGFFFLILGIASIPALVLVPLILASDFIISAILTLLLTPVISIAHILIHKYLKPANAPESLTTGVISDQPNALRKLRELKEEKNENAKKDRLDEGKSPSPQQGKSPSPQEEIEEELFNPSPTE